MKKLSIFFILILTSQILYADVCPSLQWSDFSPGVPTSIPAKITHSGVDVTVHLHSLQKDFLTRNKVDVLYPPFMYIDEEINFYSITDSPSLVSVKWDSITQQVSCDYAYVNSPDFIPLGTLVTIRQMIAEPVNSHSATDIKWTKENEKSTYNSMSTDYHPVSICEGLHGETPISPQNCSWQ